MLVDIFVEELVLHVFERKMLYQVKKWSSSNQIQQPRRFARERYVLLQTDYLISLLSRGVILSSGTRTY